MSSPENSGKRVLHPETPVCWIAVYGPMHSREEVTFEVAQR